MNSFKATLCKGMHPASLLFLLLFVLVFDGSHSARANGVVSSIGNGQVVTGTLTGAGVDSYSIYVPSGGSIFVTMTDADATWIYDPSVEFFKPNGTDFTGCSNGQWATCFLNVGTTSGVWTLKLSRIGQGTSGGAYSMSAAVVPGSSIVASGHAGGAMTSGVTYTGTDYRASADIFTFQGIAGTGNTATITVGTTSGSWDPRVAIYSPDGNLFGGGTGVGTYTFSVTNGTYTAIMTKWGGADTTLGYSISASGNGVGSPTQGKVNGATCLACKAAANSMVSGAQPGPQSGEVVSDGAASTPPIP